MSGTYIVGSEKLPIEIKGTSLPAPILLVSDLSVTAGQNIIAISTYTVNDAGAFYLGISSDSGTPEVSVDIQPVIDGLVSSTSGVERILNRVVLNNNRALSEKYEMKTNIFRVMLTNHSTATRLFRIHLYKSNTSGLVKNENTKMEHYGRAVSNRPVVSAVPVGAIYMAIDTQEVWQSNGLEWKVL